MTEYSEMIEKQRKLLKAEKWAAGVKSLHAHRVTSMWYETRPYDMQDGSVLDTIYNDGTVERRLPNGGLVFMENEKLTGDSLIHEWEKYEN